MGEGDFMKDPETGIVHNVNVSAIEAAKSKKKRIKEEKERIEHLENDVSEIKDMLSQILGKMNGN